MLQVARHLFTNLGELLNKFPYENGFPCIISEGIFVKLFDHALPNSVFCPEVYPHGDERVICKAYHSNQYVNGTSEMSNDRLGNGAAPNASEDAADEAIEALVDTSETTKAGVCLVIEKIHKLDKIEEDILDENDHINEHRPTDEALNVDQYLPLPSVSQASFVTANSVTEEDNDSYQSLDNSSEALDVEKENVEAIKDTTELGTLDEQGHTQTSDINSLNLRTDILGFPHDKENTNGLSKTFSDPVVNLNEPATPVDSRPDLNNAFVHGDDSDGNCAELEETIHSQELSEATINNLPDHHMQSPENPEATISHSYAHDIEPHEMDSHTRHQRKLSVVDHPMSLYEVIRSLTDLTDMTLFEDIYEEESEVLLENDNESSEVVVVEPGIVTVEVVDMSEIQSPITELVTVKLGRLTCSLVTEMFSCLEFKYLPFGNSRVWCSCVVSLTVSELELWVLSYIGVFHVRIDRFTCSCLKCV